MEKEPTVVCLMGHKERQELETLLKQPRKVEPLKDYKVTLVLGPGKTKRTSVRELAEEYMVSEEGQLLMKSGSLTFPLVDYVKEKFGLTSVETLERMEKELMHFHNELTNVGLSSEDVTRLAKKDKKSLEKAGKEMARLYSEHLALGIEVAEMKAMEALNCLKLPRLKTRSVVQEDVWKKCEKLSEVYSKFQKLGSEMAEVEVKEALERLNLPGLKIRSVVKDAVWKKCKQLFHKAGLRITNPGGKDEYDIQMIYPDGDSIGLILIEVKSGNSYPWDPRDLPPNSSLLEGKGGSWHQLHKGYTFTSELFGDITFGKVQAFTALPNTTRKVLEERLGQTCCMPWVLTREDFQDLSMLRTKLGVDKILEATSAALEALCTMASRLVGSGSGLYVNLRQLADVRPAEEAKLRKEMEEVDNDIWVIFDAEQEEAVLEAVEQQKHLIAIEGPPGSGKTLIGSEILRRLTEKVQEKTDNKPIVLFTSSHDIGEYDPLGKQLKSNAEQMGGRFVEWNKLREEKGVERVRIERSGMSEYIDNLPEQIAALGDKLAAESGGKSTLIMIDEAGVYEAPEDKEQSIWNWSALERIPSEVYVVLLFNPGLYHDKSLLLPSSCLRLRLRTTYRSTKSIINLFSCLPTAWNRNTPSANPGTEVVGELPKLVVLGDLRGLEEEEKASRIRFGFNTVRSFVAREEESEVTVIDEASGLSSLVAKQAEDYGWTRKGDNVMFGGEADRVVVVGSGWFEAISRARLTLGILLCCSDASRINYNFYAHGYQAAIEQGLVEVAIPPWHPKFSNLRAMLPSTPQRGPAAAGGIEEFGDPTEFHNWAGRGAADLMTLFYLFADNHPTI